METSVRNKRVKVLEKVSLETWLERRDNDKLCDTDFEHFKECHILVERNRCCVPESRAEADIFKKQGK